VDIPTRIKIFGKDITIGYLPMPIPCDDGMALGTADYTMNRILLATKNEEGMKIPKSTIDETFLHELAHWIFYFAGTEEMRSDEPLTDRVANVLHELVPQLVKAQKTKKKKVTKKSIKKVVKESN